MILGYSRVSKFDQLNPDAINLNFVYSFCIDMSTKSQKLDSLALLIIALSAVVVSIWQANLTREHNRLTVQPYVKFGSVGVPGSEDNEIQFTIHNKGAGAALIKDFQIETNGTTYDSWQEMFAAIDSTISVPQTSTVGSGMVLAPNEVLIMSTISRASSDYNYSIFLSVEFESLYGEVKTESVNFSRSSD